MTWLNPAALVGLLALAVPVLVHLFGRRTARRQRFPSLRLLRHAPATPAKRSRPHDILLLVLRCATVASAALALTQPLWMNADRIRAVNTPVRAIIVDTGLSMQRLTIEGGAVTAVELARQLSRRMADSSREAIVIETDFPGGSLGGAASWLRTRSGLREVVIVSDFQEGAVHDGNLAAVARGIGIRTRRVLLPAVSPPDTGRGLPSNLRVEPQPLGTAVTWDLSVVDSSALPVSILPAPDDNEAVRATIAAVRRLQPATRASHDVTVLFPGRAAATANSERERMLALPWQGDLLLALRRNRLLGDAAAAARPSSCTETGTPVVHNDNREPLAVMTAAVPGIPGGAVIVSCMEPGTVAAVALVSAVESALSTSSFEEMETTLVPDERLRLWERPPTDVAPRGMGETSPDGRWLWLAALLFLLAEEWFRRRAPRRHVVVSSPARHERVA